MTDWLDKASRLRNYLTMSLTFTVFVSSCTYSIALEHANVSSVLRVGRMDLGTDCCYAGVLLALLRSHTQSTWRVLGEMQLLARRMPSERKGERILTQAGDNACQV